MVSSRGQDGRLQENIFVWRQKWERNTAVPWWHSTKYSLFGNLIIDPVVYMCAPRPMSHLLFTALTVQCILISGGRLHRPYSFIKNFKWACQTLFLYPLHPARIVLGMSLNLWINLVVSNWIFPMLRSPIHKYLSGVSFRSANRLMEISP